MFNHQPPDYICPVCTKLIAGIEDERNALSDIVYQNEHVIASIAPKWWVSNPGHVLVMPKQHYENLYDIPDDVLSEIYSVAKQIAIAMRNTYDCQGTSTRQHNEPAGDQDLWHMHVHVFPRYDNDDLYTNHDNIRYTTPVERAPYSEKLRTYLERA